MRKERPMSRPIIGTAHAAFRKTLRHLDTWTLTTLNANGRIPRLG
jgi:hypothetical protein